MRLRLRVQAQALPEPEPEPEPAPAQAMEMEMVQFSVLAPEMPVFFHCLKHCSRQTRHPPPSVSSSTVLEPCPPSSRRMHRLGLLPLSSQSVVFQWLPGLGLPALRLPALGLPMLRQLAGPTPTRLSKC
jgi:hypothetical protein